MRLSSLIVALALVAPAPSLAAQASPRVVGGHDAPAGTYDAVASVAVGGTFGCTGTLIAPAWVLSAAHCGSITGGLSDGALGTPIGFAPSQVRVTLGTINSDGSGGEPHSVDQVLLPQSYLFTQGFDITLLHLTAPAGQAPVKIAGASAAALWKPGVLETIAGFGLTAENASSGPAAMQEAQVPIVTDAICGSTYRAFEPTTQLCAGYEKGGTDSCSGDSGGPLFGHDALGVLKLVGATSYGDGCARAGRYGVYARISDSTLREWIRSKVPEAIDDAVVLTKPGVETPQAKPAKPGAFSASAAAAAVTRATAVSRGVRVRVRCSAACTAKVRLLLDSASRRRLGRASSTLASVTLHLSGAMRVTRVLRLPRSVLRDPRAKVTLTTVLDPTGAGKTKTVRRRVLLSGRA